MNLEHAALLLGATGGIGQEVATVLNEAGKPLVLVGRDQKKLDALESSLKKLGAAEIYSVVCDITCCKSRQKLLDSVTSLPLDIDVMINNVGINQFGVFDQQSDDEVTSQFEVNTISPLLLIKLFIPYFLAREAESQIINIGSTFGTIAYPGFAAYSASKFAFRGATEALLREYADTQLNFRYFAPRATQTQLNSSVVVQMNEELGVTMDCPTAVAQQLRTFIDTDKPTQYLGWPEKLFVYVNMLFPQVVSGQLKKALPIIKRYARLGR